MLCSEVAVVDYEHDPIVIERFDVLQPTVAFAVFAICPNVEHNLSYVLREKRAPH